MNRRRPYVGEGADGCLRSADIDRSEADGIRGEDRERIVELLGSASRWEEQAIAEALEVEVLALHRASTRYGVACTCGAVPKSGGHQQHLADVIAAWFSGRGAR